MNVMAKALCSSVCAAALIASALAFALAPDFVPLSRAETGYTYTAETTKPALKSGSMTAGDLKWECKESRCTNSGPWKELGIEACRSLAQAVGAIKSFGRPGAAYDEKQLSECNKVGSGIGLLNPGLLFGGAVRRPPPSPPSSPLSPLIQTLGTSCTGNDQCDDRVYCNGTEFCRDRICRRVAELCDDGIACTVDR